jgi:class 3 adenylate cyclase
VNVASRVEAMTREIDRDVLLTPATVAAMGSALAVESTGEHELRGIGDRVELFAPVVREAAETGREPEPILASAGRLRRGISRRLSGRGD